MVYKLYEPYAHPLARIVRGIPISWEPIIATVRHRGFFDKAAWSPCNKYIAVSCSDPTTIEILDAMTLERLHTFETQNSNGWLSFSPDSRSLTQFSAGHDGLTTWDLQTGGRISTIPPASPMVDLQCFSSTYSTDGKMVAVAYQDQKFTGVSTYDLLSRSHTYSHRALEGRIVAPIWTHGECLRFATVNPGFIIIWEVGFTSIHTLTKVESFPAPDDIGHWKEPFFIPTLSRLAFTRQRDFLIWDARDSKLLLNFPGDNPYAEMSFSSDGCFFACGGYDEETHLWKETPAGYILHRTFVSGTGKDNGFYTNIERVSPLFSPSGESIITSRDHVTQLWRTADPISPLSSVLTRPTERTNFLLDFSLDGSLLTTARWGDNTATVLDLKSGNPRLVVDTGVGICGLRVIGNAIIVVSDERIVAWKLPVGDYIFDARANTDDSIWTTVLSRPASSWEWPKYAAISPNSDYMVTTRGPGANGGLDIYDMSTGNQLTGATAEFVDKPWITPDGCEVWLSANTGWKVIKDGRPNIIGLERLPNDTLPPAGYPWTSSHGHGVTDDGWIFNSRGEQLMWLPHHWRDDRLDRTWSGRFLGFLDNELPEPIIIELDE